MIMTVAFKKRICIHTGRTITKIRKSRTLAAIPDTLLPKLLSGQIRIRNAQKLMEAEA